MPKTEVFNASDHPVDDADGRTIAAGSPGSLDLSVEHNQRLVDDGHLIVRSPKARDRAVAAQDKEKS